MLFSFACSHTSDFRIFPITFFFFLLLIFSLWLVSRHGSSRTLWERGGEGWNLTNVSGGVDPECAFSLRVFAVGSEILGAGGGVVHCKSLTRDIMV